MHNMKIKMKFVELKAAGIPMHKIAEEIGVHRTTLTHWYKELAPYILIAKQELIDELFFENCSMSITRIEIISRNLGILYGLLNNDEKRKELNISVPEVLDRIIKYTKLLKMETSDKSAVQCVSKGNKLPEESSKIWITNKENFNIYQPENEEDTDISNVVEISEEEEMLGYDMDMSTLSDKSDEPEEVQKVFERTLMRNDSLNDAISKMSDEEFEEFIKNSSKEENEYETEKQEEQTE